MPYDHTETARQIAASRDAALAAQETRLAAAADAAGLYRATAHDSWCAAVDQVRSKRLLAVPETPLQTLVPGAASAPDYTVVATDSSFVPPDKHRGAFCYLINVGRVMIAYGTDPVAELDSTPTHHIDPLIEGEDWMVSGRLLQAQCALQEIAELYRWSAGFGADLALLDGSLMQLGLALAPGPEVQNLVRQYSEQLDAFTALRVPIVGYVSRPASQAVMHATRLFGCRAAREAGSFAAACEARCPHADCSGLWTLDDGGLFWDLLDEGTRSPVFTTQTAFGVQASKRGFWEDLGFFYLRTPFEVARVEFPLWMLEAGLLDRVQAILLHQCALGDGYPRALTLAHNFAVLHNEDRASYYYLLEQAGLIQPPSEKARGKQATGGRI